MARAVSLIYDRCGFFYSPVHSPPRISVHGHQLDDTRSLESTTSLYGNIDSGEVKFSGSHGMISINGEET